MHIAAARCSILLDTGGLSIARHHGNHAARNGDGQGKTDDWHSSYRKVSSSSVVPIDGFGRECVIALLEISLSDLTATMAPPDSKFVDKICITERRRELIMAKLRPLCRSATRSRRSSRSRQGEVLARSLDKERAFAREKRNFVTTTSHEFHTPLTAIDGQAQRRIAAKERAHPHDVETRAENIRAAVCRVTSLVENLTNAFHFAEARFPARMTPFDLEAMLRRLVRYYDEIGAGTAVEDYAAGFPKEIVGDPELLYRIFSNLLSNAFKYSAQGAWSG
jgi:signal transduction histidine kinase